MVYSISFRIGQLSPWEATQPASLFDRQHANGLLARPWSETTTRLATDQIAMRKYDATAAADKLVVDRVAEVAEKQSVPRAHISLAWLLHKAPVVAPIIGATKLSHLESAVEAVSIQLTSEEMAYLEEPYVPHGIIGHS